MDFKGQCVDDKLLFPCVAFGIREMDVIDLPRQLRNLRAMIVQAVLQPRFVISAQPAHWEICEAGYRLRLGFLCGGEPGTGFADMRGMASAGKFFIGFVLTADFAVMPMRTA